MTAYRRSSAAEGSMCPVLRSGRVDAVVFTSPSAVDNMAVRFETGEW